jgi:hypothetical protein
VERRPQARGREVHRDRLRQKLGEVRHPAHAFFLEIPIQPDQDELRTDVVTLLFHVPPPLQGIGDNGA